jgi:hypothetical protein
MHAKLKKVRDKRKKLDSGNGRLNYCWREGWGSQPQRGGAQGPAGRRSPTL